MPSQVFFFFLSLSQITLVEIPVLGTFFPLLLQLTCMARLDWRLICLSQTVPESVSNIRLQTRCDEKPDPILYVGLQMTHRQVRNPSLHFWATTPDFPHTTFFPEPDVYCAESWKSFLSLTFTLIARGTSGVLQSLTIHYIQCMTLSTTNSSSDSTETNENQLVLLMATDILYTIYLSHITKMSFCIPYNCTLANSKSQFTPRTESHTRGSAQVCLLT